MIRALLAAAAILFALPTSAQQIRKNVADLTSSEVAALRQGFAVMIARNDAPRDSAEFRQSLQFWANAHAHFGRDCDGPVVGAGMTGIEEWRARGAVERGAWCSCEHGSDQFLVWHRIFIAEFEKVLRRASGGALTLPFWDYAEDPLLPGIFRQSTWVSGSVRRPNPLRADARRSAINNGSAGIAASVASPANAMAATTFSAFRQRLERTPHDQVHCAIGVAGCDSGLMGAFATAGTDPIFWLHHANIDRLYECWMASGENRVPSDPALLDLTYGFGNRNGSLSTRRVGDNLTLEQLGYAYAKGSSCAAAPQQRIAQAEIPPETTRLGKTSKAPVEFQDAQEARVTLVIDGLVASEQPGAMFDVYLENARGVRVGVGVIDFLGDMGGDAHVEHDPAGERLEIDVTEAATFLKLNPGDEPSIYIEATSGLDNSTPDTAGLNPRAVVTYRRAWLTQQEPQ